MIVRHFSFFLFQQLILFEDDECKRNQQTGKEA